MNSEDSKDIKKISVVRMDGVMALSCEFKKRLSVGFISFICKGMNGFGFIICN